ncbi:hypothetical protein D3C80_1417850 [compost metagenome]
MRFANVRKHFNNTFWYIKAISLTCIKHHINTAERMNRTLERSITLHTYDLFLVFIQISRSVRNNTRRSVHIYIQYSACFSFLLGQIGYNVPQLFRVVCCTLQECFGSFIRCNVSVDKIASVNFSHPLAFFETSPSCLNVLYLFCFSFNHRHLYSLHLYGLEHAA